MAKNYYETLGVPKDASPDDIKKAFRKLAHQYHPDKGEGNEAKFKEINEAYQVLSNPEKRRQYDQFGSTFDGAGAGGAGFGGFDFRDFGFGQAGFEDIFSDLFGGGGRGGRVRRGSDIQVDVEISFEEMVRGAKRTVRVRRHVTCETCKGSGGAPGAQEKTCDRCQGTGEVRHTTQTILGAISQVSVCDRCQGRGKIPEKECETCRGTGRTLREDSLEVDIPAGIENGQAISLPGAGEAGAHGVPAGDLFVVVHVKPHPILKRRGDSLFSEILVDYPTLVLGGSVPVETIDGSVDMKIPAGTAPGEVFRIRGKGAPSLRSRSRGDQLVSVKLRVPKKVDRETKRLLEALKEKSS